METTTAQTQTTTAEDPKEQFARYLDVVNRAIDRHKNEFPYKQIIAAGQKMLGGKHIGVSVYRDSPDKPEASLTMQLSDGQLNLVEGQTEAQHRPRMSWKVSREHIDAVLKDPETYIAHPARLDLDWLRTRFRVPGLSRKS